MIGVPKTVGARRSIALMLTALALALKVAVPPGYMIAAPGAPFLITICTGHGPLVLDAGDLRAPKPPPHKMDAPCTGAGNVAPISPPLAGALAQPYAWAETALGACAERCVAPGLGLAAPPPPSHAPPALIL
jgi:hypothetical protein